jgi:hypothetical protein
MYSTRRIRVEDVSRVVALCQHLHNDSRYNRLTYDAPKMAELLSVSTDSSSMACFVCVDSNDEIIGAIGGTVSQPGFARELLAHKQFFVLDPQARGFIQAKLLLRALEAWARSCGAIVLNLFIDYGPDDARVAKLCQRSGFVLQGIALTKEL